MRSRLRDAGAMLESMEIGVLDDECFDLHRCASDHPERPERLAAARSGLAAALPSESQRPLSAPSSADPTIATVHGEAYSARLSEAMRPGWGQLDADTYFCPETYSAAIAAASGSAVMGRLLATADLRRAIALVRPPGHHARPTSPMGFCLINNIAVAAEAARSAGAARVAIVDWDVHHGNGTQECFESRGDVLFVSLHQRPLYPGTGAPEEIGRAAGVGATINVGFGAGTGSEAYGAAFRDVVMPAIERFDPDVVLVSAGFDAHALDPLAGLELESATYGAMAGALHRWCGESRSLGLFLEGGYNLSALEESVHASASALVGRCPDLPEGTLPLEVRAAIDRTLAAHR